MTDSVKLLQLAGELAAIADERPSKDLLALEQVAKEIGRSWSGSWLGYQSRVYYADLEPVPPGARFSIEWGFRELFANEGTVGHWVEYDFQALVDTILAKAQVGDIEGLIASAKDACEKFEEVQAETLSILSRISDAQGGGKYLTDLVEKIQKEKIISRIDIVNAVQPRGKQITRDMAAIQAGFEIPPHIYVLAEMGAITSPYTSCSNLAKLVRRAASHVENVMKKVVSSERVGINIFIGHGRSGAWKDLKEFIEERLHLPHDEFNRVPIAGFTNIARLSEMLNSAALAFIVLTAEDEQADGKMHARLNVIHEAGLFQGRLGFEKAILLVEEGCEAFSNVQGLGQIRFPVGDISAKFEDIRRVLEREGLLD